MTWLEQLWEDFKEFMQQFLNSVFDMLKEVFYFIFEALLTLAVALLDGLGEMLDFNPAEYISQIPPEVANMIGLIGLGSAVSIITTAIVIRLLLQLIPFTRLGS